MGLVNGSIPGLTNGVSQQADSQRLPSQGTEQVNAVSSLMDGLGKRPPTTHLTKISTDTFVNPYIHYIDRDQTERYVVAVYPNKITVLGTDGTKYPVYAKDAASLAYLNCPTPNTQIKCQTVSDTTFILNRTVVTGLTGDRFASRGYEALVWVRQGVYKCHYTIKVAGTAVTYLSAASDPATIQTTTVAADLTTQLATALGGAYVVTRFANTIWIKRVDAGAFSITISDDNGDNAMSLVTDKVQHFSDLPANGPNGYVATVTGNVDTHNDDYYVQFQTLGAIAIGKGLWTETAKPRAHVRFNADLMPHILVRKQDTTGTITGKIGTIYFSLEKAPWSDRAAGDDVTCPPPSFNGLAISDIFLHRNRLGMLAEGFICMSQSGNLYNFWRQTATTLLDNDAIDVAAVHERAVNLRHAISYNQELIVFADHTQFVLSSTDILSPKTVSFQVATEYSTQLNCPPVHAANVLYFPFDNGEFSGVREYSVTGITQQKDARDITTQCPRYITGSVSRMVVAPIQDTLLALSSTHRNTVWVYRWFWNGQDKVQSSWGRWTFGNNSTVIGVGFLGDVLYLVTVYADGTYLEKMRIDPGYTDPYSTYPSLLDRRVSEAEISLNTSVYFDAAANRTIIRPPYFMDPVDDYAVVTRASSDTTWVAGREVTILARDTTSVTVQGDVRKGFFLGRRYEMRYTFSNAILRKQSITGSLDSVTDGRLQLKDWTIKYNRSGYFRCEVTPDYRDTATYPMTGQTANVPALLTLGLGNVQLRSGLHKFPVLARNTGVKIEIVNDSHLPCFIAGAEWVANHWSKAQPV